MMTEEERLKRLVQVQKDYIKFLDRELSSVSSIAWFHGYRADESIMRQGEILRLQIKNLEE